MSTRYEPGAAVPGAIPLAVPCLKGREWHYLQQCLAENQVSSAGPLIARFEAALADYLGARHAVATSSGTAALHLALLVAGVQPGDEVITSSVSFIAPANAIRYAGAWPVFLDVDPRWWQIDPLGVQDFLEHECTTCEGVTVNRRTGRPVRALLPVHILGHPVDVDPLRPLAERYRLALIEDAAESLGAEYKGRKVGTLGDAACLSFNGNKVITTGGGGMLVTSNGGWAARARYLATQAKDDPLEYVHNEVGFNYRLTNLQAAVGLAQLEQLDGFVAAKRAIAATYASRLASVAGVTPMAEAPWARSTWWLWTARISPALFGCDSRALLRSLEQRGIMTRPLWQPLHRSPAHRAGAPHALPVAESLHREALSLPSSVDLAPGDQARVTDALRDLVRRAA
jgi:perosamine synthetase